METGGTLGHYTIIRQLGNGGMGEVYLADDTTLDRQVAIKILPETLRNDVERLARFRREAKAAASLKHHNIATIYALEEADGLLFIVMEYVDGKPLTDCIPTGGMDQGELDDTGSSRTAPTFFATFIPLAHAHSQGRIHRDLKPANIMIAEGGTPKILDVGLARIIDRGASGYHGFKTCYTLSGVAYYPSISTERSGQTDSDGRRVARRVVDRPE
jgi:serine/threonine protein kinase